MSRQVKIFLEDLQSFVKRNGPGLLLLCFLLTLSFGHFLFSSNYRIDSMVMLVSQDDEFNDMELGRFGIVFLNRLLGLRRYNPYMVAFLALLTLSAAAVFFSYTVWKASEGACGKAACLLPLLIFLTPTWVEQLFFSYQSFLILLGVLMLELGAFLAEFGKGYGWRSVSALLCFLAFSVYQSFVPLYLCLATGTVLLRCICMEEHPEYRPVRSLAQHLGVLAVSLAAYLLVGRLLRAGMPDTAYLSAQVRWGREPFPGVAEKIIQSAGEILTGRGRLDTLAFGLSALCSLSAVLVFRFRGRERTSNRLLLPLWFGLQLSAFAMLLLLGSRPAIRSELARTFAIAFNFQLPLLLWRRRAVRHSVLRRLTVILPAAAMVWSLWTGAGLAFRLMYTDDMVSQQDHALATRLVDRLSSTGASDGSKPVVYIGEPELRLNAACLEGEAVGYSLFRYHVSLQSTNTIISQLMKLHGLETLPMRPEDATEAEALAREMPCFPAEGSILETDQLVTVKFSDDRYYAGEILTPGYERAEEGITLGTDDFCRIEQVQTDGKQVLLEGFQLRRGVDSRDCENTVYLLDRTTQELFRVSTACRQQLLAARQFAEDGVYYESCGFSARCPMALFERYPSDSFELLIRLRTGGEDRFTETGVYLNLRMLDRMSKAIVEGQQYVPG